MQKTSMLEAFEEQQRKFTERQETCGVNDGDEYFFCAGALFVLIQVIDGLKHGSLRERESL